MIGFNEYLKTNEYPGDISQNFREIFSELLRIERKFSIIFSKFLQVLGYR